MRRPHHRQALRDAQRGLRAARDRRDLAPARHAGGAGRDEGRRQRGRCGHRRQCRARFDGAHRKRHRWRPVRHRVGSQDEEALRLQRFRPFAQVAHAGRVPAPRPEGHPAARPVAGHRAGHGGRVVRAARPLRPQAHRRRPRAGHPLRARRPSSARSHRLLLGAQRTDAVEVARLHRAVHHRRRRQAPWSAHRRDVEEPEPCQHPFGDRQRRPRRVLQGRHRAHHRCLLQGQRRLPELRRPGLAHRRMGRAGQHQLPRRRRVGTAAERAGHRRAADPQPARTLRPEVLRLRQPRTRAPVHRGQEARLRRPRGFVCRCGLLQDAGGQADRQALRTRTRQADLDGQGGQGRRARRDPRSSTKATRST